MNKDYTPLGIIGSYRLALSSEGSGFEAVNIPQNQRGQEDAIVRIMDLTLKRIGFDFYNLQGRGPVQKPEVDDYHFTLPTGSGEQDLELLSVNKLKGIGSHDKAPAEYNNGDMVDFIYSEAKKKSDRYGSPGR